MCVTSQDQLLVRGSVDGRKCIRLLDAITGSIIREIIPSCHHPIFPVNDFPTIPDCVLECCWDCNEIRKLSLHNDDVGIVYDECRPCKTCAGPHYSLLVLNDYGQVLQLEWNEDKGKLGLTHETHKHTLDLLLQYIT